MEKSRSAEPRSVAIRTASRAIRSTQAPVGRLRSRNGACAAAARSPVANAEAPSDRAAISGTASVVTSEPSSKTLSAAQSLLKSVEEPTHFYPLCLNC
jgi:hypothetical protein